MRRTSRLPAMAGSLLLVAALGACATPAPAPVAEGSGRTAIALTDAETAELQAGMRGYLDSTQGIVAALGDNDYPGAAEAARKSGMQAVSRVSLALAARLPAEFVMLATATHQKFDAFASAADGHVAKPALMQQLAGILANCNACHGSYRITEPGS